MNNSITMKVDYETAAGPCFESLYDPDVSLGIDNNGNSIYVNMPRQKINKQGTTATGYNRNSREPWTIITNVYDSYNTRWFNSTTIDNVTVFNKYIFEKIRKMNKDLDNELSGYFGDNVLPDTLAEYINMCHQYFGSIGTQPVDTQPKNLPIGNYLPVSQSMEFMGWGEIAVWKKNSCALYLIGTPDDVEELSMFPGLIVREVSDETHSFIKDNIGASILHTQNQLIEYKLNTYYAETPTWWANITPSIKKFVEKPDITGIYDQPYSECSDFQDPKTLETINPYYEQQINPDERVYKIYIQMSNDLITTAYERSNFFIEIRNSKKKMSIKNFIEYLS